MKCLMQGLNIWRQKTLLIKRKINITFESDNFTFVFFALDPADWFTPVPWIEFSAAKGSLLTPIFFCKGMINVTQYHY